MKIRHLITVSTAVSLLGVSGPVRAQSGALAAGSDSTDRAACDLAASKTPDRPDDNLEQYSTRHLIEADGEKIDVVDQGTAHIDEVDITNAAGHPIDLTYEGPTDDGGGGEGERLLPFKNRVYVLSFADNVPVYLVRMDRITTDHKYRPVCLFTPQTSVNLLPSKPKDFDLCHRVERGELSYIPERKLKKPRDVSSDLLAGSAAVEAVVMVDLRNDGTLVRLHRVEQNSSAGPGCASSEFRPPLGGLAKDKTVLEKLQEKINKSWRPGILVAGCSDAPARWFTDHGRTYLEMRSQGYKSPQAASMEYWLVATIENGRPHQVCEGFYYRQPPTLRSVWNGKEWIGVAKAKAQ